MGQRKHPAVAAVDDIRARNGHQGEDENRLLANRELLAKAIKEGVEPPVELERDILLAGRVHSFYGPSGSGKTWQMLWLVAQRVKRGERVVVFDTENGKRIVSERLELLGVDPERVDEYLFYIPASGMTLAAEDRLAYESLLDELRPVLIVFDSLINFLASCGLEENSNDDVARWSVAFCHPARNRGIAVAILDHIPKEGMSARGAGRKKDEVDVMWRVLQTKPFNRDSVGELILVREKDREGWLPPSVKFSIGGGSEGFVFAKSAGTIEEPNPVTRMTENAGKVSDHLRHKGEEGARWSELLTVLGGSKGALTRTLAELQLVPLVEKRLQRYHLIKLVPENPLEIPNSLGTTGYQKGTTVPTGTDESGQGTNGTTTLKGGTVVPDVVPPVADDYDRKALEALRHSNGPRKALSNFEEDDTPFEHVVRSVMHYWGRGGDSVDDWEAAVIHAVGVLKSGVNAVNSDDGGGDAS